MAIVFEAVTEKAQLEIIEQLAHTIWKQVYTEIVSMEQLDYMLALIYNIPALEKQRQEGQVFVLIKSQSDYIGYLSYQKYPEQTKLHKLYLLPSVQGKGYGVAMLDYVVDRVRAFNQPSLYLNVNKYNKAKRFYERYGFEVVADEVIDIGQGYVMDDFVMEYMV